MAASLIRSRSMITRTLDRKTWEEIPDGAVLQEDGIISAVGTYADLSVKYPKVPVLGSGNEVMLPGFVNGHHHVGLTPVQLGSPDMPLELWFITRLVIRSLDLYLDTLYSAFEMIGSGITTVQHIHGWAPGTLAEVEGRSNQVIKAYEDIGMRVSYCYALRDSAQRGDVAALEHDGDAVAQHLLDPPHQHVARSGEGCRQRIGDRAASAERAVDQAEHRRRADRDQQRLPADRQQRVGRQRACQFAYGPLVHRAARHRRRDRAMPRRKCAGQHFGQPLAVLRHREQGIELGRGAQQLRAVLRSGTLGNEPGLRLHWTTSVLK